MLNIINYPYYEFTLSVAFWVPGEAMVQVNPVSFTQERTCQTLEALNECIASAKLLEEHLGNRGIVSYHTFRHDHGPSIETEFCRVPVVQNHPAYLATLPVDNSPLNNMNTEF